MVFGKLLSDIRFQDIQELQKNDVRESVVLEYKSWFKGDQAGRDEALKEICAFANTFGGYLIYGISERGGQHKGQISKIPGLDPIANFKQTLIQWALKWLYPPLTNIEVSDPVPVGKDQKVCYVIHVPASLSAPHFLLERRGCFVRVRIDEHSMTFEPQLATLDEIVRLTERRKAIVRDRESIVQSALSRWEARGRTMWSFPPRPVPAPLLWAVPQFPTERVVPPAKLYGVIGSAKVKYRRQQLSLQENVRGGPAEVPITEFPWELSDSFTQQDCVAIKGPGFEGGSHLEVSAWGSFLAAQKLFKNLRHMDGPRAKPDVHRHHLIMYPTLYLLFLRNLLRCLGFDGGVLVRVELRHIRGLCVESLERRWGGVPAMWRGGFAASEADDTVSWEDALSLAKLDSDLPGYAVSAYRRLAFGVGCQDAYDKPDDDTIIGWGLGSLGLNRDDLSPLRQPQGH